MLKKLTLTEPVFVHGRDIFGRESALSLTPTVPGWWWNIRTIGGSVQTLIRISRRNLKYRMHRLVIEQGSARLNMFEHIGFLRTLGLDGVLVTCHSGWPPYSAGSEELWEAVRPHLKEGAELKPIEPSEVAYMRTPGKPWGDITYSAGPTDGLYINVSVVYKGSSPHSSTKMVSLNDIEETVRARALGRPQELRPLFYLASKCGWPHYGAQLWPRGRFTELDLKELARHRMLDIMGALGFLIEPGYCLTGTVDSRLANHKADVLLVNGVRMSPARQTMPQAA